MNFKAQLQEYSLWRERVAQAIEMYRDWCDRYEHPDVVNRDGILAMLSAISNERITLALVSESSRGKTEMINALLFGEMGLELLPSAPGRTSSCPVELFHDPDTCYLRLLDIETRLEETSLSEYKKTPSSWTHIELDFTAPVKMQEQLKALLAVKKVSREHAQKLGLWRETHASESALLDVEEVDVPCWRHALVSLPHPFLKQGLCILDTPGLHALEIEPELTLTQFPSAEAIIFIFAADIGLTHSDLAIWRKYINKAVRREKLDIAVVMNKVDALNSDLLDESGVPLSIVSQGNKAAELLALDGHFILPVSAKQALEAQIKSDPYLFEQSGLAVLESYLADNILAYRSDFLKRTVSNKLTRMLNKSVSRSEEKYTRGLEQLEEFKRIDCDNADMMTKLMAETYERQAVYLQSVKEFRESYRVFNTQAKALVAALARSRVENVIHSNREELAKSRTTYGMKQSIQKLFDELRDVFQEAVDQAYKTVEHVDLIHNKFDNDYGIKVVETKLFFINQYQFQIEQIIQEGEQFRSSARTAMTEQTFVIKQLYTVFISRILGVFEEAHQAASEWSGSVLLPLIHLLKEYKKQIASRQYMLRKISGSKEADAENIVQLEQQLVPLKQQLTELQVIIRAMKSC